MSESNSPPAALEIPLSGIPWIERLEDHNKKIDEYLQNCIFRGCNIEGTVYQKRVILEAMFRRVPIADATLPTGQGHLLTWELLSPVCGSRYLGLIISSLLTDDLALSTSRKYMNVLRDFCEYVQAKPYVPGEGHVGIADKYGPIIVPFSKYDLPIHAADRPGRTRHALAPRLCDDFFEFLRVDYIPNHALAHVAARNYTAIVFQIETGARNSELVGIRSDDDIRDINSPKSRVRLFGKGAAYSGKRPRWVPLTPFAAEVLKTFQTVFKPMFPKSLENDYLFLNEDGSRLTKYWYWKTFRKIVDLAIAAGVQVPGALRPHDLRRTYATNELEKNPLAYRKVLKYLGHSYPSSAAPYLIATDEDVDEQQSDLIDIFVDPYIERKGED